jgi:branched-chain amino acid transport system ATP-binding protein
MTTAIEFNNVTAGYKDLMILNDLSLKVAQAKITLLIGPNGAGKSTVLKTLFGFAQTAQR